MLSRKDPKKSSKDNTNNNKSLTAEACGVPNVAAAYLKSLEDVEVIERVRCCISDAHIFKLPSSGPPTAAGWRGADWTQQVWQGSLKVVERNELTVILLVDSQTQKIFAVCPVKDGAVDRCVDSSRYFVLRVENTDGKHMFVGMAFNERNDAFDFNTSLEDAKREKQAEIEAKKAAERYLSEPAKDYSIKQGEKIRISVNKVAKGSSSSGKKKDSDDDTDSNNNNNNNNSKDDNIKPAAKPSGGGFLRPSSKDTPRRTAAK